MNAQIESSGFVRNTAGSNRGATPPFTHLWTPAETVSCKSTCSSVPMSRKIALSVLVYGLIFCGAGASIASAAKSLLLPQSTAFSILGRSCGGIQ